MSLLLLSLVICLLQSIESVAQSSIGFSHPRGFYITDFDLVLTPPADLDGWQVNLELMRHFAVHRADVIRNQLAAILLRSMRMDCHLESI